MLRIPTCTPDCSSKDNSDVCVGKKMLGTTPIQATKMFLLISLLQLQEPPSSRLDPLNYRPKSEGETEKHGRPTKCEN